MTDFVLHNASAVLGLFIAIEAIFLIMAWRTGQLPPADWTVSEWDRLQKANLVLWSATVATSVLATLTLTSYPTLFAKAADLSTVGFNFIVLPPMVLVALSCGFGFPAYRRLIHRDARTALLVIETIIISTILFSVTVFAVLYAVRPRCFLFPA